MTDRIGYAARGDDSITLFARRVDAEIYADEDAIARVCWANYCHPGTTKEMVEFTPRDQAWGRLNAAMIRAEERHGS
jgi:hypothetical protein